MYLSPITLTGLQPQFSGPELFKYNLPIARQRLLETLVLRGTPAIEINGHPLTREDIIRIFDDMADDARLKYHLAIWQDPVLLRFLEEGVWEAGRDFAANALYETDSFRRFVSPWYAQAIDRIYAQFLSGKGDRTLLSRLESHAAFLDDADRETAYRSVNAFAAEKERELAGILEKGERGEAVPKEKLLYSLYEPELFVLNSLPPAFGPLRDRLAQAFCNISTVHNRLKNSFLALAAAEKAASLNVQDEEFEKFIVTNLSKMRSRQTLSGFAPVASIDEYKKGIPRGAMAAIVAAAVCILLFVVRVVLNGQQERVLAAERKKYVGYIPYDRNAKQPEQAVLNYIAIVRGLLRTDSNELPHLPTEHVGVLRRNAEVYPVSKHDAWPAPTDTSAAARKPGAKKQLHICNHSSWSVVVWYLVDEVRIRNCYLPPHDSLLLQYTSNSIRLDIQAGKNWTDSLHHVVNLYFNRYDQSGYCLKGGFSELPANRKKFCNPEYLSLYSRNGVLRYAYDDRIEINDSSGNNLLVRKYMDEGREVR